MPKLVPILLPVLPLVAALLILPCQGVLAQDLTLYVAPNGNDAWSGRLAEPKNNDGPMSLETEACQTTVKVAAQCNAQFPQRLASIFDSCRFWQHEHSSATCDKAGTRL